MDAILHKSVDEVYKADATGKSPLSCRYAIIVELLCSHNVALGV